jgi:hypothetical protein
LGLYPQRSDYVIFQQSVNANVKGGAKTRQEILLRKLFQIAPALADIFDPSIVVESGVSGRITALSDSIVQLNNKHSASTGATSCHTHFPLFVIVSGSSAKDPVHTFPKLPLSAMIRFALGAGATSCTQQFATDGSSELLAGAKVLAR